MQNFYEVRGLHVQKWLQEMWCNCRQVSRKKRQIQILFSFSSDKDRRTDIRIRRKNNDWNSQDPGFDSRRGCAVFFRLIRLSVLLSLCRWGFGWVFRWGFGWVFRWGFGWVDKAQCFRSARRFGAAGSSPDFSRGFSRHGAPRPLSWTFFQCTLLSYPGQPSYSLLSLSELKENRIWLGISRQERVDDWMDLNPASFRWSLRVVDSGNPGQLVV